MRNHFTLLNVLNSPDLGKSINGPNEKPPHTSYSSPSPHSPLTPLHSLTAIPLVAGALPLGLGGSSLYHAHCVLFFSTGSTLPASPASLASSWARTEPWSWHSCFSWCKNTPAPRACRARFAPLRARREAVQGSGQTPVRPTV